MGFMGFKFYYWSYNLAWQITEKKTMEQLLKWHCISLCFSYQWLCGWMCMDFIVKETCMRQESTTSAQINCIWKVFHRFGSMKEDEVYTKSRQMFFGWLSFKINRQRLLVSWSSYILHGGDTLVWFFFIDKEITQISHFEKCVQNTVKSLKTGRKRVLQKEWRNVTAVSYFYRRWSLNSTG